MKKERTMGKREEGRRFLVSFATLCGDLLISQFIISMASVSYRIKGTAEEAPSCSSWPKIRSTSVIITWWPLFLCLLLPSTLCSVCPRDENLISISSPRNHLSVPPPPLYELLVGDNVSTSLPPSTTPILLHLHCT